MSLKEIAERVGISVGTVSLVLNNKASNVRISEATRQAVLQAARELGYTPNIAARRLRQGGNQQITLAIAWALDSRFGLLGRVLRGIQTFFETTGGESNLEVVIETFRPGQLSQVPSLQVSGHFHGIIVGNSTPEDDQFLENTDVPYPVIRFHRTSQKHCAVNSDGFRASQEVVDYLIGLGHRQIGLVIPEVASAAVQSRVEGFKARMAHHGLENSWQVAYGPFTEAGGLTAARHLLESDNRPTAIFVLSDTMAVGALHAAKRLGLSVPRDLSLVGYDDSDGSAYLDPPLTTVRVPIEAMGAEAARLMVEQLHRRLTEPKTVWFPTELVIRESCAKLEVS